jgi:hypothetical protein
MIRDAVRRGHTRQIAPRLELYQAIWFLESERGDARRGYRCIASPRMFCLALHRIALLASLSVTTSNHCGTPTLLYSTLPHLPASDRFNNGSYNHVTPAAGIPEPGYSLGYAHSQDSNTHTFTHIPAHILVLAQQHPGTSRSKL